LIAPVAAILLVATAGASDDALRAEVAAAMRDAEARSSLLLTPEQSGHDGGFVIRSNDGDFELNLSGQLQSRWIALWRDDGPGADEFESGFQLRRTKLTFQGHVFDPRLTFKASIDFPRNTGSARLSDGFVAYALDDHWTLTWGQFKLPFTREFLDSSKRQLAVERSLVDGAFSLRRSQGVELTYADDSVRAWLAFSDGDGGDNTDFGAEQTEWAITARAEMLITGRFRTLRSQTGARDAEFALRAGGAIHAERRDRSPGAASGSTMAISTDIAAAGHGWTTLLTATWREADDDFGDTHRDFGAMAQLGVWATDDILPFMRIEWLAPDSDRSDGESTWAVTAGATWFLHGHAAKLTIDGVWLIDDPGANALLGGSTATGVPSPEGDWGAALRVQAQVLF